ncbi:MAG: hypothetical protein IPO29_00265 [Anaerolineae bacterium]|nr:hypothetical protein [Anaerolineae bacterium]
MKQVTHHLLTGAGAARVLLAAALMAGSFASTAQPDPAPPTRAEPASPLAAATATPRLIQRILADEFEAQPAESGDKGEMPTFPDEAAAYRRLSLQNEKGEIPPDAPGKAKSLYEMARERTLLSPSRQVGGISPGAWTYEGPDNVGGRIRAIALPGSNSSQLLLGAAGGGIWLSSNSGATWAAVSDFLSNIAVNAMVAHPTQGNVVYAGTGEGFYNGHGQRGDGIFKSVDAGQTWTHMPGTGIATSPDYSYVNRLAMPADGSSILAATQTGLWRTVNDGGNWSRRINGPDFLDVKTHPTVITAALASSYAGAWYSTDAGEYWNASIFTPALPAKGVLSSSWNRVEVAFAPGNPMIAYASAQNNKGQLYKSTDGGYSFSLVNNGSFYLGDQGWYGNTIWVNPTNSNELILGGVDLYRSTNGGVSISKISDWSNYQVYGTTAHADHHVIVSPRDYDGVITKTIWIGNDGGLFRVDDINSINLGITHLTDAGYTHVEGPGITQYYGVAVGNGGGTLRLVGGTQDNGTLVKIGPLAWKQYYGGDGGYVAVDPTNSNYVYGEYVNLKIVRSKTAARARPRRSTKARMFPASESLPSLEPVMPSSLRPSSWIQTTPTRCLQAAPRSGAARMFAARGLGHRGRRSSRRSPIQGRLHR